MLPRSGLISKLYEHRKPTRVKGILAKKRSPFRGGVLILNRGSWAVIEVYYPVQPRTSFAALSEMSVRKKILIIEGDEVVRELMGVALLRRGHEVTVVEDGVEGYDTAVSLKPDLIVTDIRMPAADGLHLMRRVRDTPSLEDVPILVTTAFGTGTATFSLQNGADAYEPKPIDLQSFLATVERLLAGRDTLWAA